MYCANFIQISNSQTTYLHFIYQSHSVIKMVCRFFLHPLIWLSELKLDINVNRELDLIDIKLNPVSVIYVSYEMKALIWMLSDI